MSQLDFGFNTVEVKSFTDPTKTYTVNVQAGTCTCPAFQQSHKPCKHIHAAMGTKPAEVTMPDIKVALSCLIKCVRLRMPLESAYWFHYLWVMFPKDRWRVCRRVLIMAGEDNVSVPVQVSAALWLRYGGRVDAPFKRALVEVLRICKLPNWWAIPEGHEYMSSWKTAYWMNKKRPYDGMAYLVVLKHLEAAIRAKDTIRAFICHTELYSREKRDKVGYCTFLLSIAEDLKIVPAIRQLTLIINSARSLYGDDNYEGQALWWLCGNTFPYQEFPVPTTDEINAALGFIDSHHKIQDKLPVPTWCCDGIHTSGADRRFAGVVNSMVGCCRAYAHYGRLNPADPWLKSFWE